MPQHNDKFERNRVFVLNDPFAPRLNPALAKEIGLNESIIFLQLEFLIAISENNRDGDWWTFQSEEDLKNQFPFWCKSTINRTIHSLQNQGLIVVDNFNTKKYDRTRWFSINFAAASQLQSLTVRADSPRIGQKQGGHESGSAQFESGSVQFESTIPKTSSKSWLQN